MKSTRTVLCQVVRGHPGWQVAWEAHDGSEAVRLCTQDTPELILMDLIMQDKNGVDTTREIMATTPCAILVVTAGVDKNASLVFEALAAGALDAVDLPMGLTVVGQRGLIAKIQTVAMLIGRTRRYRKSMSKAPIATSDLPTLVAIGASAGGPAALSHLLEQLPVGFPAAVVIVQHLDKDYADGMAAWLSSVSRLPVTVAKPGERPKVGSVLLAGTNDHLVLQEDGTLAYTKEPTEQPYRPSVDEFFASVALNWAGPIVGVILTGMGHDGARGLLALRRLGHLTFAQDRGSSIVYGMPGTAVRFGAAMAQMNPADIGKELIRIISDPQTAIQSK
jgi:chemotaxis response regulator CheB